MKQSIGALRRPVSEQFLDHKDDCKDGVGELEACAGKEAEEGAPGGFEGFAALLAADKLADKGTDKRPEYHAYESRGAERQADDGDDKANVASCYSGLAAAVSLSAPRGDDVVEHGDDNRHRSGGDKKGRGEVGDAAEMDEQQTRPTERRSGKARHNGADDADKDEEYCENDEYGVHLHIELKIKIHF